MIKNKIRVIYRKIKKTFQSLKSLSWCNIVDAFQTSAISATDDYKLKHLVEEFQLSGNLI